MNFWSSASLQLRLALTAMLTTELEFNRYLALHFLFELGMISASNADKSDKLIFSLKEILWAPWF